jgi:hypothetical protein
VDEDLEDAVHEARVPEVVQTAQTEQHGRKLRRPRAARHRHRRRLQPRELGEMAAVGVQVFTAAEGALALAQTALPFAVARLGHRRHRERESRGETQAKLGAVLIAARSLFSRFERSTGVTEKTQKKTRKKTRKKTQRETQSSRYKLAWPRKAFYLATFQYK